ncbi:hypothetical protein [Peptostreptococcus stomatis]
MKPAKTRILYAIYIFVFFIKIVTFIVSILILFKDYSNNNLTTSTWMFVALGLLSLLAIEDSIDDLKKMKKN